MVGESTVGLHRCVGVGERRFVNTTEHTYTVGTEKPLKFFKEACQDPGEGCGDSASLLIQGRQLRKSKESDRCDFKYNMAPFSSCGAKIFISWELEKYLQ